MPVKKLKKDSTDTGASDSRKNPERQDGTLSRDAAGNSGNMQADKFGNEDAMSRREKSVTEREEVTVSREETADQRDAVAQAREEVAVSREEAADQRDSVAQAREDVTVSRESAADQRDDTAQMREDVMRSREQVIQEAEALKTAVESHIVKLRRANEQLVIAATQAQTMSEEVQKAKVLMDHMAQHDFLTGLPNRILFKERLIQAISLAKRHDTKLAVLFMDLDRFKTINDSLGHAVGDTLLQSVAQRLTTSMRSTDTVSRHGGDEFVALLSEVTDEKAASAFADKMCKAVIAPYALAEQMLHIGVTIGISLYPHDGTDAETLIRNADVAMYHGKNNGGSCHHFFAPEMNARAVERQRTEGDLYRALEQQEFELYYQAQVELQTGNIIGAEALIRWHHPDRGLLLPGMFVPIAEQCGAIVPIGHWVLREACRQTQAWVDAGLTLPAVAVNVSAMEFGRADFLGNVHAVLRETRLAPHHLELELTESVLMKNAESTMIMLQELKSMGIKIAVDDFGTGYSSLSYLKRFPVDTLKIDQSFVAGIACNDDDDILVDAVIGLGKNLRHRVIAEGIETREQLAFLSGHHCTEGQGYYLSRPMIAEEFSTLLATGVSVDLLPQSGPSTFG